MTMTTDQPDWQAQRERMLREQLLPRGISDERVLRAMGSVPRQEFIPPSERDLAYGDGPLPIGHGQTISQPYMVAVMAQLLELEPTDRLLDIGCGSGYAAAVLSRLCLHVYSVELVPELARQSAERLQHLGYGNVTVRCGDGRKGWPQQAPFDAIHVAAAALQTPESLLEQLATGGRMVIPLGRPQSTQSLAFYRRTETGIEEQRLGMVEFVELKGGGGQTSV